MRAQVGPVVPVVSARADLKPGTAITVDTAARALEMHRVPARYAPPRALSSVSDAVGYRLAVKLDRGDYVTDASLASGAGTRARDGGRTIEVTAAGAGALAGSLQPGTRVDVLITTDRRTYLALQDAEVVAFSPSSERATAALRVSLRQAVLLTAAQSFARELRLVPRPAGDRRKLGAVDVSAAGFGR